MSLRQTSKLAFALLFATAGCGSTSRGAVECPANATWDGEVCVAGAMRVECPAGTTLHGDVCSPEVVVDCPVGTRYVDTRGCVADQVASAEAPPSPTNTPVTPPAPTSLTVHSGGAADPIANCNCLSGDAFCFVQCRTKQQPPTPPTEPFNREAAETVLGVASSASSSCKKHSDPSGKAIVRVVFGGDGRVKSAEVGPPFARTPLGACIEGTFKTVKIPPFVGQDMTVPKPVSL